MKDFERSEGMRGNVISTEPCFDESDASLSPRVCAHARDHACACVRAYAAF